MDEVSQTRLSRRKLMAAAMVMPMTFRAPLTAQLGAKTRTDAPDPLIAKAAAWISANACIDALSVEADNLQGQVFEKAKALGFKSEKACRSRMPEARAARMMKRDIDKGYRDLELLAGDIRAMPAISVEGALAKIELGLCVQGPFDWHDHALELAEEGIVELRRLMATEGDRH